MGHELGCCGYDELSYKPPVTKPIGRANVVAFNRRRSYRVGNIQMSGMWLCPECTRLSWTCEDLGPGTDRHYGMAKNRGQLSAPRCIRHPDVAMVLSA